MPLRIATADYFESLERFLKHLPTGKDPELVILKGHLLVERLLDTYLANNLARSSAISNAGFDFSQKLAVVEAVHPEWDCAWLWQSIRLLNRIRNRLAHRLEDNGAKSLLEEFFKNVESSEEFPELEPPKEIVERLDRALFAVYEALSHRANL